MLAWLLDVPPLFISSLNIHTSSSSSSSAFSLHFFYIYTPLLSQAMVAASPTPARNDRFRDVGVPVIDLSLPRSVTSELVVKAGEEFGFFKVVGHGVADGTVARMAASGSEFFSLPGSDKHRAGPPNPLGYGCRAIGSNGDSGEVEYLLLHTSPASISQRARTICSKDPTNFSCVVNEYVEAMKGLACEILELMGEGLGLGDTGALSRLIRDRESDSLLRLNHYPPCSSNSREEDARSNSKDRDNSSNNSSSGIGFGEHTDPQILTLLRSNGVGGLQIRHPNSSDEGAWVPVPPDPTSFCVHVGDALQAMTNGRLVSVRHRALTNSYISRFSIVYFGAPSPQTLISALPEMITTENPRRYKSFTWGEYKKAMYSLRLGYNRLDLFRAYGEDNDCNIT